MKSETVSKIVKASGVSSGELVLVHFWGEDADKEIANSFVASVAALGATPLLLQQSRSINQEIFSSISQIFYKLMKCRRFTQIRVPTEANAAESNLDPQDYVQRMNKAYDIDYEAVHIACKRETERFAGVIQVAVHTGADCMLYLDLTGRVWHIDAGDGDLPCGEIYIAPVENKTNGNVFFKAFYLDDVKYSNVTLQILNGEISGSSHTEIAKHFAELPKENRIVCELGLGMNPNVTDLCGYTVLDEKMAGTFHIAVGANNMFGGENEASDHIDFVGCGKIEVIL